jgi:hypothetical protein
MPIPPPADFPTRAAEHVRQMLAARTPSAKSSRASPPPANASPARAQPFPSSSSTNTASYATAHLVQLNPPRATFWYINSPSRLIITPSFVTLMNIFAAGNVVIPAYLTLLTKGYIITCERAEDGSETWIAEGTLGRFGADDTITLLGVIAVAETRGDSWPATDVEIDAFLKKFVPPNDS